MGLLLLSGEIVYAGFEENSTFTYKKQVRSSMHAFPLNVSDKGELVAFLALWLSRFVLPYGNGVVRPETFYMASLMAEGVRILWHQLYWATSIMGLIKLLLTQRVLVWLIQIFRRIMFLVGLENICLYCTVEG